MFYDSLILFGIWFIATACVLPMTGGRAIAPDQWLFPVYLGTVSFLFFGWFWTHGGQTLGMRAWRIRVVTRSGTSLTWAQAATRFFCAMISWLFAGFGFWWIAFNEDRNAWHDLLSRSLVVWSD